MFSKENVIYYASLTVCILGGGFLLLLFCRYLLPALLPFLIGWMLALVSRGLLHRLFSKSSAGTRLLRVALSVLFLTVGAGLLGVLLWKLASEAVGFLGGLSVRGDIGEILAKWLRPFRIGESGESGTVEAQIGNLLSGALSSLAEKLAETAANLAKGIPNGLFFAVVTLISTVYFAWDLEKIHAFLLSLLPEKGKNFLHRFRESGFSVAWKYLRSYGLLMLLTFALMLTGFLLLRIPYAVLIAAVVAVLDALPVIGVGTVLVPWSVCAFLGGNGARGIGLLILLGVNLVSRQFLEPKILGKNFGMHPLLTLLLLYVGYSVFGIVGMLAVPLAALIAESRIHAEDPQIQKSGEDPSDRKNPGDE